MSLESVKKRHEELEELNYAKLGVICTESSLS